MAVLKVLYNRPLVEPLLEVVFQVLELQLNYLYKQALSEKSKILVSSV